MEKAPKKVVGKYQNPEDVKAALQRLQRDGYKREDVTLYTNNSNLEQFGKTNEVDMLADETKTVTKDKEDRSFWEKVKGMVSYEDSSKETTNDAENEFLTPYRDDIRDGYTIIAVRDFEESAEKNHSSETDKAEDNKSRNEAVLHEREQDKQPPTDTTPVSEFVDETKTQTAPDEENIALKEEQLNIEKEDVQTGEVNVRKETVHDTETIQVPVEREQIVVDSKPVVDEASGQVDADVEENSVTIPIKEEKISVHKEPVVKEEVNIRKERTQDIERISEDVRSEEINVETSDQERVREQEKRSSDRK